MKKKSPNTDEKDRMNPMKDTRNYAAGSEGEDILDGQDEDEPVEDEEEPMEDIEEPVEEEILPDDDDLEFLEDEEEEEDEDDID